MLQPGGRLAIVTLMAPASAGWFNARLILCPAMPAGAVPDKVFELPDWSVIATETVEPLLKPKAELELACQVPPPWLMSATEVLFWDTITDTASELTPVTVTVLPFAETTSDRLPDAVGFVVSMVTLSPVEALLILPAASVAFAVILCVPLVSVEDVIE